MQQPLDKAVKATGLWKLRIPMADCYDICTQALNVFSGSDKELMSECILNGVPCLTAARRRKIPTDYVLSLMNRYNECVANLVEFRYGITLPLSLQSGTIDALRNAGITTIEALRAADANGSLAQMSGIGNSRIREIHKVLYGTGR